MSLELKCFGPVTIINMFCIFVSFKLCTATFIDVLPLIICSSLFGLILGYWKAKSEHVNF